MGRRSGGCIGGPSSPIGLTQMVAVACLALPACCFAPCFAQSRQSGQVACARCSALHVPYARQDRALLLVCDLISSQHIKRLTADCCPDRLLAACVASRCQPEPMGVKGLAAWLKEQYPEAYTYVPRHQRYDHVYVDLPSVLHTVARKSACHTCSLPQLCTATGPAACCVCTRSGMPCMAILDRP